MRFTSTTLRDFEFSKNLEWLETNGLGGYASCSVSGANTRKYHGLLVASLNPPVQRMVVVSKLEETLIVNKNRYALSANQYPGAIYPEGNKFLKSFERDLFPVFHYSAGGVELKKTIGAVHNENTTLVLYEVLQAKENFNIELLPLYACRDFHSLSHQNDSIGQQYLFQDDIFRTLNYQGCPEFFISVPGASFEEHKQWYYNFEYSLEQDRGLEFREDLYTHGKFSVTLKQGDKLGIIISTQDPSKRDASKLYTKELKRREEIIKDFSANENLKRLALAADQFIVKRGKLNTIVAGYPWFSDWGRDTMISLTGLCFVTKRFKIAKNIIQAFSENISEGMLPNRFTDYGEAPEYNTVDATLWFFQAVLNYYKFTQDLEFLKSMLPCLQEIIKWHDKGTRYNIHIDSNDELLYAGQDGVQLTWMDAKVGDWVVTPRKGKPVEINALWYNALTIMSYFFSETKDDDRSTLFKKRSQKVLKSFNEIFWNPAKSELYDFVDGDYKNDDTRPNQLYAISLPYCLLDDDKAKKVLTSVSTYLLTVRGIRSLSPTHKDYRSIYAGDVHSRDGAYHQGTAWSFLLGAYIDSLFKIEGEKAKPVARSIVNDFLLHLDEGCVGSISEIFDGDAPHLPRGCVAQAWGVAELLRVIIDYKLM